jgi:hypothetical protein
MYKYAKTSSAAEEDFVHMIVGCSTSSGLCHQKMYMMRAPIAWPRVLI